MKTIIRYGAAVMTLWAVTFSWGAPADSGGRLKEALAQNDEIIHTLLLLDRNVISHAMVFIHDLETKGAIRRETAGYHSTEMLRSLDTSEAYLQRLSKSTDIAIDAMGLAYLNGMHQHYLKAIALQKEIGAELLKATPQKARLEVRAIALYLEMLKAQSEQLKLDSAMEIREPELPQAEGQ